MFCSTSWLALTDPRDVARMESKTYIVTDDKRTTTPTPMEGVDGKLAKWLAPEEYAEKFQSRFPGCMKGNNYGSKVLAVNSDVMQ